MRNLDQDTLSRTRRDLLPYNLGELIKESLEHHSGCRVHQTLTHRGDCSSELDVTVIRDLCPIVFRSKGDCAFAPYETDLACAVHTHPKTMWRIRFEQLHLAFELARDTGDEQLHLHRVLVFARFHHLIAPRHTSGKHFRVLQK